MSMYIYMGLLKVVLFPNRISTIWGFPRGDILLTLVGSLCKSKYIGAHDGIWHVHR